MTARDVMNPNVKAARPIAVGRDLAFQLIQMKHNGLPVVDSENRVIGMVTGLDLLHAVEDGKDLRAIKAEDIMMTAVISAREDEDIHSVIHKMIGKGIICLPVEGDDGKLVGIISRADILRHLLDPFIDHFDHPAFVTLKG